MTTSSPIKQQTHTIDANNKALGRVASEAAKALMGKMSPSYTPNILSVVKVTINNAGKLNFSEKKLTQKVYTTYTQYPGGLKHKTLAQLNAKNADLALRRAIERMMPRNTFRTPRMKNLTINQ
jgi:large subunit ribosomal protein L13